MSKFDEYLEMVQGKAKQIVAPIKEEDKDKDEWALAINVDENNKITDFNVLDYTNKKSYHSETPERKMKLPVSDKVWKNMKNTYKLIYRFRDSDMIERLKNVTRREFEGKDVLQVLEKLKLNELKQYF
jgi:hypothetical protein